MNSSQFQQDFFSQIDAVTGISHLFDFMPEVQLFVKNAQSQFTKVNQALIDLVGADSGQEVIGKTDYDFHAHDIAEKYIEEDRQVMSTQKAFVNKVWLVPNSNGLLMWYLCTKIPLFDRKGQVIGIAGILRDYKIAGSVLDPYAEIAEAFKYINDNYHKEISIPSLAELANLSVSQFERKFKKLLHTTPLKYITKLRLNSACESLSQSNDSITQIALSIGYCDHSYFTKIFTRQIGITPKEYRKRYHKIGSHPNKLALQPA
jgi:AraC-like DNA-binding protein